MGMPLATEFPLLVPTKARRARAPKNAYTRREYVSRELKERVKTT